jgi:hypothetical protein
MHSRPFMPDVERHGGELYLKSTAGGDAAVRDPCEGNTYGTIECDVARMRVPIVSS